MAADPLIFCLEKLTDYLEFERFCCAFLCGVGYPELEPMGGSNDGGRDAVIRYFDDGRIGVFAFSAQAQWKAKLRSVSERVKKLWPQAHTLAFVCTTSMTASDKDWAHNYVAATHGWRLDLYDLERLRMHLGQGHRHLVPAHPSIFTPSLCRDFYPPAQSMAQRYLTDHAFLFTSLRAADSHLAVEIPTPMYEELDALLRQHAALELACFDELVLPSLKALHQALLAVWGVISDEHYIHAGWRVKFNNSWPQGAPNPQRTLAAKKVELEPLLRHMRDALDKFEAAARASGPRTTQAVEG